MNAEKISLMRVPEEEEGTGESVAMDVSADEEASKRIRSYTCRLESESLRQFTARTKEGHLVSSIPDARESQEGLGHSRFLNRQ